MKTRSRVAALTLAAFLPVLSLALPAEGIFSYSGYLRTSSGAPETTLQSITFTLYDADSAGNVLWTQAVSVTPDSQGWFSAVLGGTAHALPPDQFDNQLWLGIRVGSETEMVPRTKIGVAPHALTVDWGGVLNRPAACATGQFVTGYDPTTGAALCATPSGSGGGVSSVTGAGVISASPTTGAVSLSLTGCPSSGQILQWTGTAWTCIATPVGGGGVSSVSAAAPLVSSGGATPTVSMSAASGSADGYLSAASFASFAGKVSPPAAACGAGQVLTWSGTAATCVAAGGGGVSSVTATSPLASSGGATPNVSMSAASGSADGYLSAASFASFAGKVAPPAAACGAGQVLTWSGTAATCVTDAGLTSVSIGAGLTGAGTAGSPLATSFAGTGAAATAARSDHTHAGTANVASAAVAPPFTGIADNLVHNVISVTGNCPAASFLLLVGSGYSNYFGDGTRVHLTISTTASTMDAPTWGIGHFDVTGGAVNTARYAIPWTISVVKAVSAGTFTYYLNAQRDSLFAAASVNVQPNTFSALCIRN